MAVKNVEKHTYNIHVFLVSVPRLRIEIWIFSLIMAGSMTMTCKIPSVF